MDNPSTPRPQWWDTAEQNAATAGVDPQMLWKLSGAESSYGANMTPPPGSTAAGPFGITQGTFNDVSKAYPSLALSDWTDPNQQAKAAPFLAKSNAAALTSTLGRPPSEGEQYLAWFLGAGGAAKALHIPPGIPAALAFPVAAASNPSVFNKLGTVGDLRRWADDKMGGPSSAPDLKVPGDLYIPHPTDGKMHLLDPSLTGPGISPESLSRLDPIYQDNVSRLVAAAPPDIRDKLKIISGWRPSFDKDKPAGWIGQSQEELYNDPNHKGPVAPPGGSDHNKGIASDWDFSDPAVAKWLTANAGHFNLAFNTPGDPNHMSLLDKSQLGGATTRDAVPLDPVTTSDRSRAAWDASQAQGPQTRPLWDGGTLAGNAAIAAKQTFDLAGQIWETSKYDTLTGDLLRKNWSPQQDTNWSPTAQMIENDPRLAGVPLSSRGDLADTQSKQDYDILVQRLADQAAYNRRMADAGASGGAARVLGQVLDPAGWLLGAIPMLGGAAKATRIARMFTMGLEGAAGGAAVEAARSQVKPDWQADSIMWAAAGGLAFGTGLGAIIKPHPTIKPAVDKVSRDAAALAKQVEATYADTTATNTRAAMASESHALPADVAERGQQIVQDLQAKQPFTLPTQGAAGAEAISEHAQLTNQRGLLAQKLASLSGEDAVNAATGGEAPAKAAETLARVEAVRAQIETAKGDEKIALVRRLNELLQNTTPEALQAKASTLEGRRAAQAALERIDEQIAALEAKIKPQGDPTSTNVGSFLERANTERAAGEGAVEGALGGGEPAAAAGQAIASPKGYSSGANSVGAAVNLGHVENVRFDVEKWLTNAVKAAYDKTNVGFRKLRFDIAARSQSTDNQMANALGSHLTEEGVGYKNGRVANRAVSVEADMLEKRTQTAVAREAKANYDAYAKRQGWGFVEKRKTENTTNFARAVADAVDETDPSKRALMEPEVVKAADALRKAYGDFHDMGVNPGVLDGTTRAPLDGMKNVAKDPYYHPHIYDFMSFGETVRRFGDKQMRGLLADSIASHLPAMDRAMVEKIAAGLYKGLRGVEAGQEIHLSNILSGADREGLAALLRDNTGASEDEIRYILSKLMDDPNPNGAIARTKMRTPLNVHHEGYLKDVNSGEMVPVKMKDFMVRDAFHVFNLYARQMSQQIAWARLRIADPLYDAKLHGPGGIEEGMRSPWLVDGVRKDGEWQTLLKQVNAVSDANGLSRDDAKVITDRLQFVRDALTGRLMHGDNGKIAASLRVLRDFNYVRVMNQVGWNKATEVGRSLSEVGVRAAYAQMPSMASITRDALTGELKEDVARQIESMCAPGTDMIRGIMHLPTDEFGQAIFSSPLKGVENGLQRLSKFVGLSSGLMPIHAMQQRLAAKGALARFALDATGEKALNMRRMAVIGIDEDMRQRIADQMGKYAGMMKGASGNDLKTLNLNQWDDKEALHALSYALHLWTRKMIHENDLGQLNTLLGTRVGKLMFQFRMFSQGAYVKNTLHNLQMGDYTTVTSFLSTSALAALAYTAETYTQSLGRSDQDKFLQNRLNPAKLAEAAFQRSAWASLMPMAADVGTYALGADPLFDTRASGTPAQGLVSNPSADLADNVLKAMHGFTRSAFTNEALNQQDVRALVRTLPLGNSMPIIWAANALVSGLPARDTHKTYH